MNLQKYNTRNNLIALIGYLATWFCSLGGLTGIVIGIILITQKAKLKQAICVVVMGFFSGFMEGFYNGFCNSYGCGVGTNIILFSVTMLIPSVLLFVLTAEEKI